SLVTARSLAPPGTPGALSEPSESQNDRQERQPLLRNASNVDGPPGLIPTWTGAPSSVVPAMSEAGTAATRRGGWGSPSSSPAESASGGGPRRRRISAWLRRS